MDSNINIDTNTDISSNDIPQTRPKFWRAKRQETKEKRLQQIVDELKAGDVYMKMKHPAPRKNKG